MDPQHEMARAAGSTIAGYRIERLLGQGGLGAVYLAHDAHDEQSRPIALKVLNLGGAERTHLLHAFEREVALGRRLQHPGIVRILDAGEVGELAFVAMEYVAGGDLAHLRLARQPFPIDAAIGIAARVARALEHAHEQGILHGDVKAANILVDEAAGWVKLGDFGLARLADMQRSRTGVLAGTPACMSPEQLAEGPLDARSDLYSLGVVLFELLTARLPHQADSLGALLRAVMQTPAPAVRELRPDAPPALATLTARLLEKDRERRPESARALADTLEGLLQQTVASNAPRSTQGPSA